MHGITGVTGAAPVMHEIFQHLRRTAGTTWFATPSDIHSYAVHPLTGRQVSPDHPGAVVEKFLRPPAPERTAAYDDAGAVRLPPEYFPWLASPQNSLGSLVSADPDQHAPRILQPPPGATYYLDPDIPLRSQWIPLRAESGADFAAKGRRRAAKCGYPPARIAARGSRPRRWKAAKARGSWICSQSPPRSAASKSATPASCPTVVAAHPHKSEIHTRGPWRGRDPPSNRKPHSTDA